VNTREEIIETIKAEMSAIDADERFHYKKATVFENAPLALIQLEMETRMRTLKKVLALLEEGLSQDEVQIN
jgi:hypothetical protein